MKPLLFHFTNPDMKHNSGITDYLQKHKNDLFSFLGKMVSIQSGSYNKAGVDAVGRLIESVFTNQSIACETVYQKTRGNHLIVRSQAQPAADRQVLLVGHMDTVFPEDTEFTEYRQDHANAYGPGVVDMKGGLVVGIYALKALDAAGLLKKIPITFIFNSDEEIGSGTSRDLIRMEAQKSAFACVLEAGGLNGEVVVGRKGNLTIRLEIEGKAGHAAFAGPEKASAIVALAQKTIAFERLNAPDIGVSANVGQVGGGVGPNTIPDNAWAKIDFRFVRQDDHARLIKRIDHIVKESTTPGTRSTFKIVTQRPPMPETEGNLCLYNVFATVANELGLQIVPEFRQGVSDANIISMEKVAVIDGLGPIGGKDHSRDEFMTLESLYQRALLLAHALFECWRKYQKGSLFQSK